MREILTLQVGGSGNRIGLKFWEMICEEHSINSKGEHVGDSSSGTVDPKLEKIDVFFKEVEKNKYVPRSIFTDLQPDALDSVRGGPYGMLFRPESFVNGIFGGGNNWSTGMYTNGAEITDEVMDVVRKEVEEADHFQVIHNMGGGTGGGLTSNLVEKFREEFTDRICMTTAIHPDEKTSSSVVQSYNTVFTHMYLVENCDLNLSIENSSLYDLAFRKNNDIPSYRDFNQIVSHVISGVTCSLRFPGKLNCGLLKLAVRLNLFPRLHFPIPSFAPLSMIQKKKNENEYSISEICDQMIDPKNMCCGSNYITESDGKFMTAQATFRGEDVRTGEVEETISNYVKTHPERFCNWISHNNVSLGVCNNNINNKKKKQQSATFLGNTTAISVTYRKIMERFEALYRRKAFFHYFTRDGMDEMEMTEAKSNFEDMISELEQYRVIPNDDDYDDDDEEE